MSLNIQELWKIHREGVRVIESGKYSDQEKERLLTDLYRQLVDIHGELPSKPKKPGRKGTRIRDAFDVITSEPQSLDDIMERFDVSLATMRQHNRFDPFPDRGKVRTRTIAGTRMVWREP